MVEIGENFGLIKVIELSDLSIFNNSLGKFGLMKVIELSDLNCFCSSASMHSSSIYSADITDDTILSQDKIFEQSKQKKENKYSDVINKKTIKDCDSDDDLPSFQSVQLKDQYSKGQVVFAKIKKYPYWPAVFYKMASKSHGYIHFLEKATENTKQTIKVPLKNIKHFICTERDEIISIGRKNDDFNFGMNQAEDYLRKRALGKIPSFFDNPIADKCIEGETQTLYKKNHHLKMTSDSDTLSEITNEKRLTTNEVNKNDQITKGIAVNPRLMESIMLSRITLQNIATGKEFSYRHTVYTKGNRKEKSGLKWLGGYGPLNDQESDTVVETLLSWYKEDHLPYNPISYVLDVWLPESIIRGIASINNLNYEEAEELYQE
ncbi:PWWP domain-containing DNA repair factor 3B isoform X6 [Hydra vulgaris]|uniref:PWWP domain-containing DNA repair factor 3B isoform X6 n=1 Tax=Hydra vulgaris TaxID=6087 RepID=A0ABM4DAY8_HYDVU